ncbi:helix-turn-helix transcriptional regulator [Balneatrix alpica]|uniref:AraC family transcriptional regulator n=1 Tax=Balneatrix alpica TaxID=75684 RepID=A0ABV5ZET2_9GAMM|nr:AraC family transcriptional regulator [Balneatrix alpica]
MNIQQKHYQPHPESHQHAHHQWVLPLSGELWLQTQGRDYQLSPTLGLFIHAHHEHAFAAAPQHRFLVIDLPCQGRLAPERLPTQPLLALDGRLQEFLTFMASEPLDSELQPQWLSLLLGLLEQRLGPWQPALLVNLLQLLQQHPDWFPSVEELAAQLRVHPRQLQATFQQSQGQSLHPYLQQRRYQYCCQQLRHCHSITEAALNSGFAESASFNRFIKRLSGLTPSQLRQQLLGPFVTAN